MNKDEVRTAEDLIALAKETPDAVTADPNPVAVTADKVDVSRETPKEHRQSTAPPFPEDTPEWAKKRIAELSGKNAALKAQRDQESARATEAEKKWKAEEAERKRIAVELPKYKQLAADNAAERFKMLEADAAKDLNSAFREGDISPERMTKTIGGIVEARINQRNLADAKREIEAEPVVETPKPEPPRDPLDVLEAEGKMGVKKQVFIADRDRFISKYQIDLNAPDGTPEAVKKNIALQHDKSAVQLGYPVGSYAYWEHIEDGLRRNAPEERRESGTDHTETETRTQPASRAPIPSVAAPAARSAQSVNQNGRQKIQLGSTDLDILKRAGVSNRYTPEQLQAAILAEKQKELERA
ncbi:MAG: hypothetical protein WAN65_13410 [Candidatus Sulfotelmatobacter sp.]